MMSAMMSVMMSVMMWAGGLTLFLIGPPCSTVIPLFFSYPVLIASHKRTAVAGSGIVLCTFEKHSSWPLSKEEIRIRTVVVEDLGSWSVGKERYEVLPDALDCQLTINELGMLEEMIPELTEQQDGSMPHWYLHLRMSIKSLIGTHYADYEAEYVVAPEREKGMFFWIKAKMGLKRDDGGRPLMELVYDARREGRPVSEMHKTTFFCPSPLMFHQLLMRNHLLTDPSDWQWRKVRGNPSFKPSSFFGRCWCRWS